MTRIEAEEIRDEEARSSEDLVDGDDIIRQKTAREAEADPQWDAYITVAMRGTGQEWIVQGPEGLFVVDMLQRSVRRASRNWGVEGGWYQGNDMPPAWAILDQMELPDG